MNPRVPTAEEKQQLCDYQVETLYLHSVDADRKVEESVIDAAAIAVFDDYIADTPGYTGKMMMVVWPGSPVFYDVYTWDAETGKIRKESRGSKTKHPAYEI